MAAIALLGTALLPLLVALAFFWRPLIPALLRLGPLAVLPILAIALLGTGPEEAYIPWLFLGAQFGLDLTGRIFLMAIAFVWVVAAIFAHTTGVEGENPRRFFQFFYAAMGGNFLLIIAGDIVTFLVGFSLMSYAGYGLVVQKGSEVAKRAGRVYLALVILAEVLLFAGALLAWSLAGSWDLEAVRAALGEGGERAVWAMALIFVGFGVKAGMVPVHLWLPLAHPAAPVPASAVLSASMIKAGLLGWMRFLPFGSDAIQWLGWWAFGAGLFAAFFGVIVGLMQSHPKTILAYSSISQMGYMTVLLGLAAMAPQLTPAVWTALLVYVAHHALAKGALFLSVTIARDAPLQPGRAVLEATAMIIPALAMAGAPLTTGAVAKHELKILPYVSEGALPAILDPLLILGAVATTVLMARFLWVVWPRRRRSTPISYWALISWLGLCTAVLWGPWFAPWPTARELARAMLEVEVLWASFWPLALGALLSVVALRRSRSFHRIFINRIPPGDLLVPLSWILARLYVLGKRLSANLTAQKDRGVERGSRWSRQHYEGFRQVAVRLEARLLAQAWDWFWILIVALALLWVVFV